jgi:hypothetical protein
MADLGSVGNTYQITKQFNVVVYTNPRYGRGQVAILGRTKYTLSGNVKDDTAANCARRLVAYRRNNGEFVGYTVSDASTGNWSIGTPYNEEHDVICLDDAAGTTYNDLVLRATPA